MAKSKANSNKNSKEKRKPLSFKLSSQQKLIVGSFLAIFGVLLCISFISFFFTGDSDQSAISNFGSRDTKAENWLSKSGAWLSDFFILKGFGISAFIFSGLIFLSGLYILLDSNKTKLRSHWFWGLLTIVWISVLFGFFSDFNDTLGGTVGYEINSFLQDYLGIIGTIFLLLFVLIVFLAIKFKLTAQTFIQLFKSAKKDIRDDFNQSENQDNYTVALENNLSLEAEAIKSALEISLEDNPSKQKKATKQEPDLKLDLKSDSDAVEPVIEMVVQKI
jgi:S-DNA-T family DNA segregation ATPase FtsK/SpoIIIE